MMWLYQSLDILSTITESVSLLVFGICFCKKSRFHSPGYKWCILGAYFICVYAFTWCSELGAYKMLVFIIIGIVILKIFYKDSIYQCVVAYEVYFLVVSVIPESISTLVFTLILDEDLIVRVGSRYFLSWETYFLVLAIRVLTVLVVYKICRKNQYRLMWKDALVLTIVFATGFFMFMKNAFMHLNLGTVSEISSCIVEVIYPLFFMVFFLYVRNTLYLREQEQKDKMQIAQLQKQFDYYQAKQKDEEKVRAVYHDMKNHLLILQQQINSPETAEMIEELQAQVAMYEDYVHTGNGILDIILREKSELAREKQIALSVSVDFNGVDFIEPLDISTIFGNGLDNAIEASEKLPVEQRTILVKTGKIQNFLSIVIQNNCMEESKPAKKRTTKSSEFLHGFGISNMQKAAGKYDGELITTCENGKFVLKILIPIL